MSSPDEQPVRFVIVPKVEHPWYDEVLSGARHQAATMSTAVHAPIEVSYAPPEQATLASQQATLESVLTSKPQGIAIDPVEPADSMPAMILARESGVPVVAFDSPSPTEGITGVGNNFAEQGAVAARRLAALLDGSGEVAVMQGVPHAPNHLQRYRAQLTVLEEFDGITVIDGGIDHDDITTARAEAARVLAANPHLRGYLACDASGPIGIAQALVDSGRSGEVTAVGMDSIAPIAQAVADGVLESSVATIPRMQGAMSVLMLWQATLGLPVPRFVDTGIEIVTAANAKDYLPG
ncbi:MAG: substrate-binding domain-containing protein [Actinobacteria bacterium]|nr:substrate-binding domain-containing protein [Actinomycetota bacterium]MCB9411829.1 substrate-binding domain-containing protein [Actinomycetota bacterium]